MDRANQDTYGCNTCQFSEFFKNWIRSKVPYLFEPEPFLYSGYAYRYQVTVDHSQAGSTDTANFPVLVNIVANNDFKTGVYLQHTTTLNGQTVPADLIVTTDAGCTTQVAAWEIASYDGTNGNVEIWVNNGTLSHTVDMVFYICIDNASVTTYQSTATSVWASGYKAVLHQANGTTLSGNDSTVNANGGTVGAATATTGQIDGGGAYSSQYIGPLSPGTGLNITGSITLQAWINSSAFSTGAYQVVVAKGYDNTNEGYVLRLNSGTKDIHFFTFGASGGIHGIYGTTSSFTWPTGSWHKIVGTFDGTTWTLDFDGGASIYTSTDSTGPFTTSKSVYVGCEDISGAPNRCFGGSLDEVRVLSGTISADQRLAEFNQEKAGQTMVTLGTRTPLAGVKSRAFVME